MEKKRKIFLIFRLVLLGFILIGIPLIILIKYRDTLLNSTWLTQELPIFLNRYKNEAAFIIIGLQIFQIIICFLPGQPIQFAGSYIFGVLKGYILSIVGAIIGSIITFYLAKVLGREAISTLFNNEKIDYYRKKLNSGKGLTILFLIYFIPGLPKDILGYAAGISDMNTYSFIFISTLGRTPAMFGSLLLGHFLKTNNYVAIGILSLITGIILIFFFSKKQSIYNFFDRIEERGRSKNV